MRVAVVFGGRSNEHAISCVSAGSILRNLDPQRFDVIAVGITPEGSWVLTDGDPDALAITHRQLPEVTSDSGTELALPADPRRSGQLVSLTPGASDVLAAVDVVFPVLHGPYGEDGTIQGLLDLIGIPYVGSGVLASALAMDKVMAKKVLAAEGIQTPRGLVVERAGFQADPEAETRRAGSLIPAFVKPVREGSSIGMTLVLEARDRRAALDQALACDARALVEERVVGTELTVGVLGNRQLTALPVVEIVPKREFFDYRAKYDSALSEEICPARIPDSLAEAAQEAGLRAHRALGCRGLSRVDMIASASGLVVLEVNTLPGMTVNSLLPKAARAAGISFPDLLERLIQLALESEG